MFVLFKKLRSQLPQLDQGSLRERKLFNLPLHHHYRREDHESSHLLGEACGLRFQELLWR